MSQVEELNWARVAARNDLVAGEVLGIEIDGRPVALYCLDDGEIFATDNVCTHAHALLSEGWLTGDVIECPLHGGCFNVRTGQGVGHPSPRTSRPTRCASRRTRYSSR